MKTSLDCIPCLVRQAIDAARLQSADTDLHRRVLQDVLHQASQMDFAQSPPVLAQQIHRHLRQMTGAADPYHDAKARQNQLAWGLFPELEKEIARASSPLAAAARLAIAGNVIDLGATSEVTEAQVRRSVRRVLAEPFHADFDNFAQSVADARSILYLADNAGEIVFDRLLVAQLPRERVTLAVRGAPVINDATREDARAAGLDKMVTVIDNGSDAPGTLLDDCSKAFRETFRQADLIIAKGQGNFESLSSSAKNIFFLFKIKCAVVAQHTDKPVGTHVLMRSRGPAAAMPDTGRKAIAS